MFLQGVILVPELILLLFRLYFELLIFLLRILRILYTEQVSLLQVVKELYHFMWLLEVHLLIVQHLLQ